MLQPVTPPSASNGGRARTRTARLTTVAAVTAGALGLSALVATPAHAAEVTHTVAEVQGTGAASPLDGTVVTVEGIVTADHRTGGYAGFYLQTAGSGGGTDATPGSSDGIFVYLGDAAATTPVQIGDSARVTGPVSEFFGLTQIDASAAGALEVPPEALPPVTATALPDTVVGDAREAFEGMLVAPTGTYKVSSSHQVFNFGSLWLSAGESLPVKNTEQVQPGAAADDIAAANRAERILLDDGYSISVFNDDYPGTQPYLTPGTVVRNGDTAVFPAASPYVLHYGFDEWRLQPTIPVSSANPAGMVPTFTATNPRPVTPPAVGGDASVAAFNVLNYFTTLGERGATDPELFQIQKSKIVAAINQLDADIVGLQEIENSVAFGQPADTATADLVAGLNAALGSEVWAYVPTPTPLTDGTVPTDQITNAIIYKTAAATPVGASSTQLDETVWDIAREPIAQTFDVDGQIVSVIANHFKSKSPGEENEGLPEPADGQGFWNAERVEEAEALVDFVGTVQDASGSDDVLLLGDFNAYAEEDPIDVFVEAGYVDLVPERAPGEYTYTFNGELGSLDHVIATPSLAERVTGVGVWSINSPEWSDREYRFGAAEAGTIYRSSDHDPIKVGLDTPAVAPVSIDVVSINDFHGRIEANGASAGAEVLSSAVNFFRANNPNTLFASAGDNIGASTFTSVIQNDEPTLDVLNAIGLDVSALGNHEFDQGREDVDGRVDASADFPYLGANVYDTTTGEPAYPDYHLESVDGVDVAFVGAVTEDVPSLVSPSGIETLEFRDVVTEVNRVAAYLSDGDDANGEADVIILLVHEGAASGDIAASTNESKFGRIATQTSGEVNAIVSAHTHQLYNHQIPVGDTTAVRPVIQSAQYGEAMGHLNLSVDPQTGELLSITSEVVPLTDDEDQPYFDPADASPGVADIVADAVEVADELGAAEVGQITADFNRASNSYDEFVENRGGESTLGNFVSDVQLSATADLDTEIAFMNPGGLRTDLMFEANPDTTGDADGVVTFREAAEVQPFANWLFVMSLTGEQIFSVLEEQWQPEGSSRPFLKLGVSEGFTYTYDPDAPAGSRITAAYLNGELLDPNASYRVVVNSFLASGGDNFLTFAEGTDRADSGRIDLQSMVDYFEVNPVASPEYAQRAVGVSLSAPAGANGYVAGESVTVDLSSLVFSNGGPTEGTVTVSLGGVEVASGPIDGTIVEGTDEQGRASLTFTVPAGLTGGAQLLTVTVAETGTEATQPVLIAATTGGPGDGDGNGDGDGDDNGNGGNGNGVSKPTGNGSLAVTGTDAFPIGLLAMLFLGLGLVARRVNAIRLNRIR